MLRYLAIIVGGGIALLLWLVADLSTTVRLLSTVAIAVLLAALYWAARRHIGLPGHRNRPPQVMSHDGGFMPRRRLDHGEDIETRHHPSW